MSEMFDERYQFSPETLLHGEEIVRRFQTVPLNGNPFRPRSHKELLEMGLPDDDVTADLATVLEVASHRDPVRFRFFVGPARDLPGQPMIGRLKGFGSVIAAARFLQVLIRREPEEKRGAHAILTYAVFPSDDKPGGWGGGTVAVTVDRIMNAPVSDEVWSFEQELCDRLNV